MRKTQQASNKTSFKGLLNVENEKLPQKKSRSRSIRERNNTTTNQYSRATQNDNKSAYSGTENQDEQSQISPIPKYRKQSMNNQKSRLQDNYSNLSRNDSSIEKIRQNMRRQSQDLKQKERNRSHSRRRRYNRSKENSISHPVNHFPQPILRNSQLSNSYMNDRPTQKQLMNQMVVLKNHINSIEQTYSVLSKQLSSAGLDQSINQSTLNYEEQLKQKANDLNNILQSFHINFKETINKTTKELMAKIDSLQNQSEDKKQNLSQNGQQPDEHRQISNQGTKQLDSIFNRIQKQFSIGDYSNSSSSLFQTLAKNKQFTFNDLQKRLLLAQERWLK